MKPCRLILGILLSVVVVFAAGCGKTSRPSQPALSAQDDAPLTSPTNLRTTGLQGTDVIFTWDPSPDTNVAGYNVYVYSPSPQTLSSYVLVNTGGPVASTRFVYTGSLDAGVWIRVSAVDSQSDESPLTTPVGYAPSAPPSSPGKTPSSPSDGPTPIDPGAN